MTTDRKLKIIFGMLTIVLLISLLIKLKSIPDGMILSGLFLGIMLLIGIFIGCMILSSILNLLFKESSTQALLSITMTLSLLVFHYRLYSPTLTITVPNGFNGEINLVLSNVEENMLTLDSSGIGYLTKWTFDKTYSRPIVKQMDGKNLEKNLVGFNPSTFFGKGTACCIAGKEIKTMSFTVAPAHKTGQEQFNVNDFMSLVDKKKVVFFAR